MRNAAQTVGLLPTCILWMELSLRVAPPQMVRNIMYDTDYLSAALPLFTISQEQCKRQSVLATRPEHAHTQCVSSWPSTNSDADKHTIGLVQGSLNQSILFSVRILLYKLSHHTLSTFMQYYK